MRKRKYVSLQETDRHQHHPPTHPQVVDEEDLLRLAGETDAAAGGYHHMSEDERRLEAFLQRASTGQSELEEEEEAPNSSSSTPPAFPVPRCHNIVSTSQIVTSQASINLQRLADLFPFTTYDRKRFAAITIRLANPYCTCLLFGSGKLVITGSTSFSACIIASHEITRILRRASPRDTFEVSSCQIQNLVAHVSLAPGTTIDLNRLYERFNEESTYQRSIFPGLVLRPPRSPIVLLIFTSGRIVCTGGRSYEDIYFGFAAIYDTLKPYILAPPPPPPG